MLYGRESRRVIACRANFIVSNPKIPELYPPPQPLLLVPRLFAIIHVSCEYFLPGTRIYRESFSYSRQRRRTDCRLARKGEKWNPAVVSSGRRPPLLYHHIYTIHTFYNNIDRFECFSYSLRDHLFFF